MKKLLLTILSIGLFGSVMAQTDKAIENRLVTGRFWDNWELSAGMGTGMLLMKGTPNGAFDDRLGFEGNIALTKWIDPVVGLRLQLQGGRLVKTDAVLGQLRWPYLFGHFDVMVNLSNWIGGYRDDRAYYLVPFVGFGPMYANFSDNAQAKNGYGNLSNIAFNFGLQHKFRISQAVDFHIEMASWMAKSQIVPVNTSDKTVVGLSLTAGFAYRFNPRGWKRVSEVGYSAADIAAFQQAVADSQTALAQSKAEQTALMNRLGDAERRAAMAEAEAQQANAQHQALQQCVKGAPKGLILYNCGSATLSQQEKLRLEQVAEMIKRGPKDTVYRLEGYADRQTGTKQLNAKLATERAQGVYDYLISLGVPASQLSYEGMGEVNPFATQQTNRSVVIR